MLIVDDEPAICSLIERGLDERGIRSTSCVQFDQARQLLATGRFGVLVADVFLADASGIDLLADVPQTPPACKVILITGYPSTDGLAKALSLGAYEYFKKPLRIEDLVDAISRAAGACVMVIAPKNRALIYFAHHATLPPLAT